VEVTVPPAAKSDALRTSPPRWGIGNAQIPTLQAVDLSVSRLRARQPGAAAGIVAYYLSVKWRRLCAANRQRYAYWLPFLREVGHTHTRLRV